MAHLALWKRVVSLVSFLLLTPTTLVGMTTSSAKQQALVAARPLATALCCAVRLVTLFTVWPLVLLASDRALFMQQLTTGETVAVPAHTQPAVALCAGTATASFVLRLVLCRCPDVAALTNLVSAATGVPLLLALARPPVRALSFWATAAVWLSQVLATLPELARLRPPPADYRERHAARSTMLLTSFCGVFAGPWAVENRARGPAPARTTSRSPLCTQRVVELGASKTVLFVCDGLACTATAAAASVRALARFVSRHARETALHDRLHARVHVLLRDTPDVRGAVARLAGTTAAAHGVLLFQPARTGVLVPLTTLGARTVIHLLPERVGSAEGYCAAVEAQQQQQQAQAPHVHVFCAVRAASALSVHDWTSLSPLLDQMLYGNSPLCCTAVLRAVPVFRVHGTASAYAMGAAAVRALSSLENVFGTCWAEEATSFVVCQQQGVDKFLGTLSLLAEKRTVAYPLSMMVGITHDAGRLVGSTTAFLKQPSHSLRWGCFIDDASKGFQEQCWALDHVTTITPLLQQTVHKGYWALKYVALAAAPAVIFVEGAWIASAIVPTAPSLALLVCALVVLALVIVTCFVGTKLRHSNHFEKCLSTASIVLAVTRGGLFVSSIICNIVHGKQSWLTLVCTAALCLEALLVVLRNLVSTRHLKQCLQELSCGVFFLLLWPFFECFTMASTVHSAANCKSNNKQRIGFHPWHLIKALTTVDLPSILVAAVVIVWYPRWVISGLPLVVLCLHSLFLSTRLLRAILSSRRQAH